jgi:serine/threonine-protein kinase
MAAVSLARLRGEAGFERLVAIKECHPELARDAEFAAMFLAEARLAAGIRHPNVVPTLDVSADPLFLVMDYVEGATLAEAIAATRASGRPLPVRVVVRVMIDALEGLHAAHELADAAGRPLGLVHRDVSPQNILIGVDGVGRIADFGVAKALAREGSSTQGRPRGKRGYLAPEQLEGAAVDRRTDLFAAGVVLWEALASRRLFVGDTDAEVATRTLRGLVTPPSQVRPDVGGALDEVVRRALAVEPAARWATAREMAEALEALPEGTAARREVSDCLRRLLPEVLASRHQAVVEATRLPAPPRRSRRRLIYAALGTAGVAAMVLALRRPPPQQQPGGTTASTPPPTAPAQQPGGTNASTPPPTLPDAGPTARDARPAAPKPRPRPKPRAKPPAEYSPPDL